ncbi:unnamed protein product [Rotaria sp. Silwood2]|nr:unnamed protein product [Rotaria sp. Silwood2]
MILFGLLTLYNLRSKFARQVQPSQKIGGQSSLNQNSISTMSYAARHTRKRNVQFIRLAFIQVAIFIILNSLWSVYPLYAFILLNAPTITFNQLLVFTIWEGFGLNLLSTYAAVDFFFVHWDTQYIIRFYLDNIYSVYFGLRNISARTRLSYDEDLEHDLATLEDVNGLMKTITYSLFLRETALFRQQIISKRLPPIFNRTVAMPIRRN